MATTDYSSVYTIKEFYQQHILPLYFDTDKLALSTTGDLGMFLDIEASTAEDMINIMGRYINESMPGRSELPDFIYANAANYGVTDILAQPSKMSMLLLVKENDIINYAKPVGDHTEFTVDKKMSILVDDVRFSLPFDVKIRSNYYNGEYNHMAFYDENFINSVSEETVPFLKTMKTLVSGDIYVVIRLNVYQYIVKEYNEPINTNSILNIPYIDLTFSDQLCNFEVFYTEPGSTKEIQLIRKMDNSVPSTDPFCFYKLTGDNSIRISFANDDRYFVPAYNSNIRVMIYESIGKDGDIPFNQEGLDISIRADTENEDIAYNRLIFPWGLSQGNSVGGRNQLQLEQINLLTSEKRVTVNSYTTDTDLNKYFANFASIYDHDGVFVKQRDDVANREYGCFTRIGDGIDIFPTNTLDIRLAVEDVDKHFESLRQYIVKPGAIFQYEGNSASIVTRKRDAIDETEIEYALAPLMVITTKPNKVNYYMNTVNKNVDVDYTYFNIDASLNFVVKRLNIYRDAIHGDEEYTITLDIYRVDGVFNDIQNEDFTLQSSNGDIDTDKMKAIIVLDTTVGNYIPLKFDHSSVATSDNESDTVNADYIYTFIGKVGTTDMIDNERILLTELLMREDDSTDERLIDIIDPKLTVGIFYDFEDGKGGNHNYNDISLVKDLTLCNMYEPKENEFYFAYPLKLIRSHVVFEDKPETEDGFGFYIKQVPLFGASFLMSEDCDIDQILTDISFEHEFLARIISLLHGMFTINMKFYCTYGRSRSFYIGYGTGEEIINRVNCDVALGVKFYSGIIQEDYLEELRKFVKDFIEKINRLSSGANQAFVSILSQQIHNTFKDQVEYIIFYSINGYDSKYQTIRMTSAMDDSPLPDFVPEYLTLKTSDVTLTTLN